ncbi:MAG TPA: hypothetical protein VFO17_04485 [Acidimicrobiia bacterium]|jgi:hypothetical protein|nr:hypothetical protein [Acidimicrobiia bacterium]
MRRILMTGLALVLLTACGTGEEGGQEASTTTDDIRDTTTVTSPGETVPSTSPPITGEVPEEIMNRLIGDLRDRLSDPDLTLEDVEVVRAEAVTWPNGALGCPEPGLSYTQALVEGHHVELKVGEQTFDYRIGSVDNIKLCETQLRPGG